MGTFDPDKYLQKEQANTITGFDPDVYLKKKEPTEEELESFKTSMRGVSQMPKEYASEAPSTQTKPTSKDLQQDYQSQGISEENWKTLKATSLRAAGGVVGIPALVQSTIFEVIGKPILKAQGATDEEIDIVRQSTKEIPVGAMPPSEQSEESRDKLIKSAAKIESTMKQYEEGIIGSIQEGKYGDAARQLTKVFTGSLPYMAMVASTAGGGAIPTFTTLATTSASQRLGEVKEQGTMEGEEGKQVANSWLYGGFEGAGEIVTMGIFNKFFKVLKGLPEDVIKKESKDIAKEFAKEFLGEGASEGLITDLGQQLTDYYMGNRESIDLKQIGDATIGGSFAVTPISGATATINAIKGSRIASVEDVKKVQENQEQIVDLEQQKETIDNDVVKESINNQITDLRTENENVMQKNIDDAKVLNKEEFNKVEELNKAIDEYDKRIESKKEGREDINLEETIRTKLEQDKQNVIETAKERQKQANLATEFTQPTETATQEKKVVKTDEIESVKENEENTFNIREKELTLQQKEYERNYEEEQRGVAAIENGGANVRGEIDKINVGKEARYDVGTSDRIVGDDSVKEISIPDNEVAEITKTKPNFKFDTSFDEINNPDKFHEQISKSKVGNKYAASVFVYPKEEYSKSKLYATKDGQAGLAITPEGDIISVFSYDKGKGRVPQLIINAVKEGGVSLDHYDTALTDYYYNFGFVPVARVRWNDEFAPQDWDKETFKNWNNGRPDVIAMAYHGGDVNTLYQRVGKFTGLKDLLDKTPYVDTWEEAKKIQQEYVQNIKGEKDAVQERSAETVTKEVEQVTEEKIVIPKEKKAVSERFLQKEEATRGKNTLSYKIVEEKATKSEYSQDESYNKASNIVKKNIDENGAINEEKIINDIANENPDVGNFALSQLENFYRRMSVMEELSPEQRLFYEEKASNVVNQMSERALNQGRGGASWAKIYKENPAFDARVRFAEVMKRTKNEQLSKPMEDGVMPQDYIDEIKKDLDTTVQEETARLLSENKRLKEEIARLKISKPKVKFDKVEAKRIADKVRKTLKTPKDLSFATIIPPDLWNGAVEVVAKAIEATGDIADAVRKGLDWINKQKWYRSLTEEEKQRFDKFFAEKISKDLEVKTPIEDVINEHYSAPDGRSLSEKLVDDAGLTKSQAAKISSLVTKEISNKIGEKLTEIKEKKDTGWKKSETEKILDALNNGDLTNESFTNSFKNKFGFTPIDAKTIQTIKELGVEIDKALSEKKYFLSRTRQIELNNLIGSLKEDDLIRTLQAINSWQYQAILSGVGTFYNAGIGSAASLTIEGIPTMITKGLLPSFFGVAMGVKNIKTHIKEFLAVTNTNRGFYDNFGIMDESYHGREEGVFEMMMSTPMFNYSKQFANSILGKEGSSLPNGFYKAWGRNIAQKALVVGSILKAQDAFLKGSAVDIMLAADEFNAVAEEMGYTGELGRLKRLKDIFTIMDKAAKNLSMDKISNENINKRVGLEIKRLEAKGQKTPPNYASRRAYELRMERGGKQRYEALIRDANEMVMLGTPDGIAGWLYKGLENRFQYDPYKSGGFNVGTFALRTFLLFPRMSAAFVNAVARNVPVFGMINSVIGFEADQATKEVKWKWWKENSKQRNRRLVTNAAITTMGVLLFMDMFDWDEDEQKFVLDDDRNFDFTSYGTGSFKEDLRYGMDKNFAFRFKKGEEWSQWHGLYLAPHIMPMLGFLGRWADDEKGVMSEKRREKLLAKEAGQEQSTKEYVNKIKEQTSRMPNLFDVSFRSLGEAQYNVLSRATDKIKYAQDKGLGFASAALAITASPIQAMIQPAIVRDVMNESYRWADINKKDAWRNESMQTLKQFAITEMFMSHDMTDLFGNPLPRDSRLYPFTSKYIEMYKDQPEYKLLDKYENLKRPAVYWMPIVEGYDNDDKQNAREYAKKSFGKYVVDNVKYFDTLEQTELEKALNVTYEYAKEDALYTVEYYKANIGASEEDIQKELMNAHNSNKAMVKIMKKMLNPLIPEEDLFNNISEEMLKLEVQLQLGK